MMADYRTSALKKKKKRTSALKVPDWSISVGI